MSGLDYIGFIEATAMNCYRGLFLVDRFSEYSGIFGYRGCEIFVDVDEAAMKVTLEFKGNKVVYGKRVLDLGKYLGKETLEPSDVVGVSYFIAVGMYRYYYECVKGKVWTDKSYLATFGKPIPCEKMKVILVSGKAQSGKDFTATVMKEYLESKCKSVLVIHFADLLKWECKNFFGWDGKKDAKGRELLQYVGTDVVRKRNPDYWVRFVNDFLEMFNYQWDYVIIPDVRFPNEVEGLSDSFDKVSIRIERPEFDNELGDAQQHTSETALDNYEFEHTLVNDGTDKFLEAIKKFLSKFE